MGRIYEIRDWLDAHIIGKWWWRLLALIAFVLFVVATVFSLQPWYYRLVYVFLVAWAAHDPMWGKRPKP